MATYKYSAYFTIRRLADENNPADEYEDKVCFVLDEKRHPIKLGDGSYGSVYWGKTEGGDYVAIKLLYNNSEIQPRAIGELSSGELDEIFGSLVDKYALYYADPDESATKKNKDAIIANLKKAVRSNSEVNSKGKPIIDILDELRVLYDTECKKEHKPPFRDFWNDLVMQASSSAVYRYERERDITAILRKSLRQESDGRQGEVSNIVEVKGGCNEFLENISQNPEFTDIQKYFTDQSTAISFSNYVLVTKKYDFTLKDLLERKLQGRKQNGYKSLRGLSNDLRAFEALFIMAQPAFGLKMLHNVKNSKADGTPLAFFHRDIKSANIFILVEDNGRVTIALGDLGNLPPQPSTASGRLPPDSLEFSERRDHDYAPGTRNYRSPEQKYHRDVADVSVVNLAREGLQQQVWRIFGDKLEANEPQDEAQDKGIMQAKQTVLIVQDPKFQNTLIEVDDVVIFSKDHNRQEYTITEVIYPEGKTNHNNESGHVAYVLDMHATPDEKTQVEFFKSQRYRTDLFGIGAVLFEIVTVGRSPEQFYESIRKYEGQPIGEIVERYEALRGGLIDNPDFAEIFKPFRNDNDPTNPYVEADVVELILKCLLYQSKGTFYNEVVDKENGVNEPYKASVNLYAEIERLRGKYARNRTIQYRAIPPDKSILIHNHEFIVGTEVVLKMPLARRIDELQGLARWSENEQLDLATTVANRMIYGSYYFWRMTEFIRQTILLDNQSSRNQSETEEDTVTLRQILPMFVSLQWPDRERKAAPSLSATAFSISPVTDMKDNRLELLIRSSANPFVPNEVVRMRREIRLLPEKVESNGKVTMICSCRFCDTAAVSRAFAKGDWIEIDRSLWQVIDITNQNTNQLTIEWQAQVDESKPSDDLFKDDKGYKYVSGTYFAAINPLKYYFEMLALYLQHFIFVNSPVTRTSRDRIDIYALLNMFQIGPEYSINESKLSTNELKAIYEQFVHMLVRLTLHEAEGSFYTKANGRTYDPFSSKLDPDMFNDIYNQADELYSQIWAMLKPPGLRTQHPTPFKTRDQLPTKFVENVEKLAVSDPKNDRRIVIEEIIKRSGQISGRDISGPTDD